MKLIEANPKRSEKGTNKLRPIKELIKGGIADGMSDELFDSVELEKGIKVELEHTDDEMIAKEIAKDHLAEDPEYYKKLSKIHIEKNPHSIVGEFYTNLYMVSYLKKVKKENYEANMVFDNRDNTFEVNVIKLPNYVATTKSFSTDDLGKFNLEAKKYFTDFEVDRFHKEVQKYLNSEIIKGKKKENPQNSTHLKKLETLYSVALNYLSNVEDKKDQAKENLILLNKADGINDVLELRELISKASETNTIKFMCYLMSYLIDYPDHKIKEFKNKNGSKV